MYLHATGIKEKMIPMVCEESLGAPDNSGLLSTRVSLLTGPGVSQSLEVVRRYRESGPSRAMSRVREDVI